MKSHLKRLIKETSELQVRLYDLKNMLESEHFEEKVEDPEERDLLFEQQDVMMHYYCILKKRLEKSGIV